MSDVELGDRVRDKISGFTGIVVARTEYIESCDQVWIRPEKLGANGELQKAEWFDAPWVEVVEKGVYQPKAVVEAAGKRLSGGPAREHGPRA